MLHFTEKMGIVWSELLDLKTYYKRMDLCVYY